MAPPVGRSVVTTPTARPLNVRLAFAVNKKGEPLLPLKLFRDWNFSLANFGITAVGFAITSLSLPIMLYVQIVRGLTPTEAALLLVPMAVINGALSPVIGKLTDYVHPRYVAAPSMLCLGGGLYWLSTMMTPDVPIWHLLFPIAMLGLANAGMWSPLSTTATSTPRPVPPAFQPAIAPEDVAPLER